MEEGKPQIRISEKNGFVAPTHFEKKVEERFRNIDTLIYAVVVSLVITAISALISVGAIIIDQLHFNNQTYCEFSALKTENVDLIKRIDNIECKIDNQNQQIILEQQKQILELLKNRNSNF